MEPPPTHPNPTPTGPPRLYPDCSVLINGLAVVAAAAQMFSIYSTACLSAARLFRTLSIPPLFTRAGMHACIRARARGAAANKLPEATWRLALARGTSTYGCRFPPYLFLCLRSKCPRRVTAVPCWCFSFNRQAQSAAAAAAAATAAAAAAAAATAAAPSRFWLLRLPSSPSPLRAKKRASLCAAHT